MDALAKESIKNVAFSRMHGSKRNQSMQGGAW